MSSEKRTNSVIESTPENRSRAVRALSLVDSVRLDAALGMISTSSIRRVKIYRVQSQSEAGKRYAVLCAPTTQGQSLVCSCPDFLETGNHCKHAIAVLMFLKQEAEEIALREQAERERIDREFAWFMAIDQQNWKETYLQSLFGLSASACACPHADRCNAQVEDSRNGANGREGER